MRDSQFFLSALNTYYFNCLLAEKKSFFFNKPNSEPGHLGREYSSWILVDFQFSISNWDSLKILRTDSILKTTYWPCQCLKKFNLIIINSILNVFNQTMFFLWHWSEWCKSFPIKSEKDHYENLMSRILLQILWIFIAATFHSQWASALNSDIVCQMA